MAGSWGVVAAPASSAPQGSDLAHWCSVGLWAGGGGVTEGNVASLLRRGGNGGGMELEEATEVIHLLWLPLGSEAVARLRGADVTGESLQALARGAQTCGSHTLCSFGYKANLGLGMDICCRTRAC